MRRVIAILALLRGSCPALAQVPPPPHELGPTDLTTITIAGVDYNLVTFRDPNAGIRWFDAELERFSIQGSIVRCSLLIDLPVGVADGNHSYGGFCTLRVQNLEIRVEVCKDMMASHFKLMPVTSQPEDKTELAAFVAANCYGG